MVGLGQLHQRLWPNAQIATASLLQGVQTHGRQCSRITGGHAVLPARGESLTGGGAVSIASLKTGIHVVLSGRHTSGHIPRRLLRLNRAVFKKISLGLHWRKYWQPLWNLFGEDGTSAYLLMLSRRGSRDWGADHLAQR